MNWCDSNDAVKSWQSEEKAIWYYDPIAKKKRRYFPDFIVNIERKGVTMTEVVEVKPQAQIDGPPPNPKRRTEAWAKSVMTYVINQAKWQAATEWCEDRGYNFRLISEKHLGLPHK